MHRVDTVGNSPGVHRELAEGIGSLLGWRKGVRQKKTETHREIVGGSRKACRKTNYNGSNGIISSLSIRPGSDGAMGSRWEFARRFAEGIGKLVGNTLGDRQKKIGRFAARMSEAVGLAGVNRR
ncbi:hypothetical protein BHM03_00062318 [Ensete ventricosum]|nr:hypothetical protein BHM03_00062318 [Ensete ventricosum]